MKKIFLILALGLSLNVQAQDATVNTQGMTLSDPTRGIEIKAPSSLWSINGSRFSIYLSHGTYYDAAFSMRKSYHTLSTPQESYNKRKESLKSFMPGAIFLKENESLTVSGVAAMSMTYKNPSSLEISREIILIHKGIPYELEFKVKEENFEKVKADFSFILANLKFF